MFDPTTINETGRKTFFWYRVYCAVLALLYLAVIFLGVALLIFQPTTREYSQQELMIMGVIYTALGVVFFLVFAVRFFCRRSLTTGLSAS